MEQTFLSKENQSFICESFKFISICYAVANEVTLPNEWSIRLPQFL